MRHSARRIGEASALKNRKIVCPMDEAKKEEDYPVYGVCNTCENQNEGLDVWADCSYHKNRTPH